jgi:NAD(P)-dependent dehydrogenase (short-subunit alcohol dehydrogenase family)
LVAWLAMPYNRYIAHQDRRIVVTHQPSASGLRIGERLIQADQPIVAYRRHREELLETARRRPAET